MLIWKKYITFNKNVKNEGFALPQVLVNGIDFAVGVSGLMAASILGFYSSRINRQELLAKSSSYSGITKLSALFDDNSQGRLFNYFWSINQNHRIIFLNCKVYPLLYLLPILFGD